MSTRSNLLVTGKNTKVWLYRHHDGYPADNGYDIARALKKIRTFYSYGTATFLNELLAMRYEFETPPRPIYSVTDGEHGDIEWLYDIKFSGKRASITVREYNYRTEQWIEHGTMNEDAFRLFVAKDLAQMLVRMRAIRKANRGVLKRRVAA